MTALIDPTTPLTDDDGVDDMPPVRRTVDARTTSTPVTRAARSVFDIGIAAAAQRLTTTGRFGDSAGFKASAPLSVKAKVERTSGVTKITGASYPSRWTAEDEERERQRRARQKPPRPPKKAKTRGKKLLDLIGVDDDTDA